MPQEPREATYLGLEARSGKEGELSEFLVGCAAIVQDTEPDTLLWSALQIDATTFGVFDTYPHAEGRDAHVAGEVAAALKANAPDLVEGGWRDGVVSNVRHPSVLAAKVAPALPQRIEKALFIRLPASPGREAELSSFLSGAAALIEETEPKTEYWFALQFDETTFGIFDFFTDQAGVDAHVAGEVAEALHANAADLVEGGWEDGVLKNVTRLDVLTVVAR
ncbi:MAG: putative quinol monooxygenase [Solirubrobacterales bacterium]